MSSTSIRKGRLLQVVGNDPVAISALAWTETVHRNTHATVIETEGDPVLVVERLGDDGRLSKRIVVDDDLYAWEIDDAGEVIRRGLLAPTVLDPTEATSSQSPAPC